MEKPQRYNKLIRKVKCKICGELYQKRSITHKTCSADCAIKLTELDKVKKNQRADRIRRVELKPKREFLKAAQKAFNAYIRKRDENEPCICCGEYPKFTGKIGGDWDAGHFLSVGAYPELRFTDDNCHKQLKSCNAGSGKYTAKCKTVSQSYRERLIKKIGIERVEWLEGPHPPAKWSISDLQEIERAYKRKLRELD